MYLVSSLHDMPYPTEGSSAPCSATVSPNLGIDLLTDSVIENVTRAEFPFWCSLPKLALHLPTTIQTPAATRKFSFLKALGPNPPQSESLFIDRQYHMVQISQKFYFKVWGLPYMMSAKFWDFFTPSPLVTVTFMQPPYPLP